MIHAWWHRLINRTSLAVQLRGRRANQSGGARFRPWLEQLEDRAVPATVTWINATGGAWNVPANWNTSALPGAGDDVVIPDLPGDLTITHATGTDTIRSLTSHEAVVLSGGSLTIGGGGTTSRINRNFTVISEGTLDLNRTTVDGSGILFNTGTVILTGSTMEAPLLNQGTLVALATSALNGSWINAGGSILRVLGGSVGDATLTVLNGFTNYGAIELISADTSRTATLTIPSLRNSGTIDIASRCTLTINGGTFHPQPGTVTGTGTLILSSATLNLATDFSTVLTLTLSSATVNGPGTLISGRSLTMTSSTVNAPLVNQGTLVAWRSCALNGPFTTAAGSTVRILGETFNLFTTGNAVLTVENGFTNNGTIELSESSAIVFGYRHDVRLIVKNGPLLNAAGASLRVLPIPNTNPPQQGGRTLDAQLDNQGTLLVAAPLTIINDGRTFRNRGTINLADGRSLTVSGSTGAFTNTGDVTVSSGSTFTVSGHYTQTGGSTTLLGGTLTASGTVEIQAGVLAGSGTINAHVTNAGQVNPGGTGTAGVLTINGNYTQTGTLNIDLGGLTAGTQYDRLSVRDAARLGGTLNVRLINGFPPSIGNFQVLLFGLRIEGSRFSSVNFPDLSSNLILELSFAPNGLTLVTKNRP
jgi:hypothetical protein